LQSLVAVSVLRDRDVMVYLAALSFNMDFYVKI